MKKGSCPKCGSREVYSGADIGFKRGMNNSNSIPLGGLNFPAPLDNYVCGDCGYLESYLAREKDLEAVRKKWPLVM